MPVPAELRSAPDEQPTLRDITATRDALMRQGIVEARDAIEEGSARLRKLIRDGQPVNGLLAALTEALTRLDQVPDILRRTEEEHFRGHREP